MSDDPVLPEVVAGALGECRTPPGSGAAPDEPSILYARLMGLCRVVGEDRFFRAAFSRARPGRPGDDGTERAAGAGGRGATERAAGAGGRGGGTEREAKVVDTKVVELDFDQVLRDALDGNLSA